MIRFSLRSIRQDAGSSVKSAVSYTYTRDTRDDVTMGTKGTYTKMIWVRSTPADQPIKKLNALHYCIQEFAGLGGDAHYTKSESIWSASRLIGPGMVRHRSSLPTNLRLNCDSTCVMRTRPYRWACVRERYGRCRIRRTSVIVSSSAGQPASACSRRTAWVLETEVRDQKNRVSNEGPEHMLIRLDR